MTIDTMANVILSVCDNVSNKKLQKISYYVYAWYLTIYGEKISDVCYEAWEHGPVCRRLYIKYKKYGWNVIPRYDGFVLATNEEIAFVQSIVTVYGKYSADELEEMTHRESPWINARRIMKEKGLLDVTISDKDIIDYYSRLKDIRNCILGQIV